MNRLRSILVTAASSFLALSATNAEAAGTLAGTVITNKATVNYQVGAIAQTAVTGSKSVTVDRVINMALVDAEGGTTVAIPGQKIVAMAYTVTNTSNATIDIRPSGEPLDNGTPAVHGGTDSFDPLFRGFANDTNGNKIYENGIDEILWFGALDEVVPDTSRTFFLLYEVTTAQRNGEIAAFNVRATALEGGQPGSAGDGLTQSIDPDTVGVDTVFADSAGPGSEAARNGRVAVADDITVSAATLSIVRTSEVIANPVEGSTNPKAIPGATVEYCVQVSNAAGSATANSVSVTDEMGPELTFNEAYGVYQGGTASAGECNADGTLGGTHSAGIISGTLASIAAGETKTIRYRATVK